MSKVQRRGLFGFIITLMMVLVLGHAARFTSWAAAPAHSKTLTDNENGTYNLSLSVTGSSSMKTSKTKADVIIVFDTSGSMNYATSYTPHNTGRYGYINGEYVQLYYARDRRAYELDNDDYNGYVYYYEERNGEFRYYSGQRYAASETRLDVAKEATSSLVESLLENNTEENPDTVRISFVNFSSGVNGSSSDWMTSGEDIGNTVEGFTANGGTNWEAALRAANNMTSDRDPENTYIIFVSDGNPTFRDSQYVNNANDWNSDYGHYGTGYSDPNDWNLGAAQDAASEIVSSGKHLYMVGAFGDATNMANLNGDSDYYDATNGDALNSAFANIISSITDSASFEKVSITDGVTEATASFVMRNTAKVSDFAYTITDGTTGTTYAVELGEDGTITSVNGSTSPIKLTDSVGMEYTLTPGAAFPTAGTSGDSVVWDLSDMGQLLDNFTYTVTFEVWPSQEAYDTIAALDNGTLEWSDELEKQFERFENSDGTYSYGLKTNTGATVTYDAVRRENGEEIERDRDQSSDFENPSSLPLVTAYMPIRKEWVGHEPDDDDWVKLELYADGNPTGKIITLSNENNWESKVAIAPGLEVDTATSHDVMDSGHDYTLVELGESDGFNAHHFEFHTDTEHPMLESSATEISYIKGDGVLIGTNIRKSSLDISKVVTDNSADGSADSDELFSFKITVTDKLGLELTISILDEDGNLINATDRFTGATAEIDDEGNETGYYDADSGSTVIVKLKDGEHVHFEHLPMGSTYSIEEIDIPTGYTNTNIENGGDDATVNLSGKKATGTISNGDKKYEVTYFNQYDSVVVNDLQVTKKVTGRHAKEQFTFTLTPGDDATEDAIEDGTIIIADGGDEVTTTTEGLIPAGGTETVSFGPITFYKEGGYSFIVDETTTTDAPGWTYDDSEYEIYVGIDRDDTGKLVAVFDDEDCPNNPTFHNKYEVKPTKTQIPVTKILTAVQDGLKLPSVEGKYTFTLTAGTNTAGEGVETPMPDDTTVLSGESEEVVKFDEIEYKAAGTYNYTITETGTVDGVKNDSVTTKSVSVVVTDNGDGTLTAVANGGDAIAFNNSYDVETLPVNISVGKILTIPEGLTGPGSIKEKYTFTIEAASDSPVGTPLPSVTSLKNPAENGGTVTFQNINFTKPGTYKYVIKESGSVDGVENDPEAGGKTITVVVTDNGNGKMSAVVNDNKAITFENKYNAEPTTASFPVKKVVSVPDGETGPESIDGVYSFTVEPQSGAPATTEATKTVYTSTLEGSVEFAFEEGAFTEPGEYRYTVTESGKLEGVTNDPDATGGKTVTVTVTDNGKGQLVASVSSTADESLTFTNTYGRDAKATINVNKILDKDASLTGPDITNQYNFTLETTTSGAPMPKTTTITNSSPSVAFDELTFTKAGTYEYTVTESGTVTGVNNDKTAEKTVRIVVEENDEGNLEATVTYPGSEQAVVFTNEYKVNPVEASIPAKKVLNAAGLNPNSIEGKFTFTLTPGTNTAGEGVETPMPEITSYTNPEADGGSMTFGSITYTKAGTYNYTITETGSADGVSKADTGEQTVTVTVTDNQDGTLSATVSATEKNPATFTNTYTVEGTTASITLNKVLSVPTGYTAPDITKKYTFTLTAEGDAPMPETTSVENPAADGGTMTIGEIAFTEPGEYTYKITETGTVPGVTNDLEPVKTVKIKVEDNGEGGLVATVNEGKEVTFENSYLPKAVEVDLPVAKELTTDASGFKPDITKEYTFTIEKGEGSEEETPMPKQTTVKNPEADGGTASFGTVSYTKPGTYIYKVTESGTVAGVTNDSAAESGKTITVTVIDDGSGQLKASATSKASAPLTFTNTFKSTKATLKVTKEFNDWTKTTKGFTFQLAGSGDAPMPNDTTVTITSETSDYTGIFDSITFTKEGTYNYTITEQNGGEDGITYDTAVHNIVVTVAADENNDLQATVKYDGADSLSVTNKFNPAEATVQVTKDFDRWDLAGSFQFKLEAVTENAPMPASATATATEQAKTALFDTITYNKAGTYEYKLTEVKGSADGVSYDTTEHTVIVKVVKAAGTNKLTATVEYDGQNSLTVENEFTPAKAHFEVTKDLQGRDWLDTDSFTFNLAAKTEDAPMPNSSSVTVTKATENHTGVFGDIAFEKEGTYVYTIQEQAGNAAGVKYDTKAYEATVTVTKDENNKLTASVSYGDDESLKVTNKFEPAEAEINVKKELTGRDWEDGDAFTIELSAEDGTPMPSTTSLTVTDDQVTGFGSIEFDKPGTYTYVVKEKKGALDGVAYDTSEHTVVITVAQEQSTNKLTATVNYGGDVEAAVITNEFTPATAELKATKSFNDWTKASKFTFHIAAGNSTDADGVAIETPMPSKTDVDVTEESLTGIFGEVEYTQVGTYHYVITEVDDQQDGINYDTAEHEVVVTVTKDDDNALTAEIEYDGKSSLTIKNSFASATANIQVAKEMDPWTNADHFTFELEAVTANAPMPDDNSVQVTEQNPSASFGNVTYDKAGTYEYKITEVNEGADGVTYDTTEHKVTVTVTKGEGNKLTTSVKYDDGQDDLTITNSFEPAEATLEVSKDFDRWDLADGFEFTLTAGTNTAGDDIETPMPDDAADGSLVKTATAASDKKAIFGEINYTKAGTYNYTITETKGSVGGVTYDATTHNVVVTVSKDSETNELTAEVQYDNEDSLSVENEFEPTSAQIYARKSFDSWDKADEFEFTLTPVDGSPMPNDATSVIETATRTAQTVGFGEITFEKEGVYEYQITETNGGADGVTYDTTPHTVIVTVSKDADTNALSAKVTSYNSDTKTYEEITNTYASTTAEIEVTKSLTGREWTDEDEFEFKIEAVGNTAEGSIQNPMPDETTVATSDNLRTASFGDITFEKAGTYTYKITETNDHLDGVAYDTTEHIVVVTVAKDTETNALSTSVTYDNDSSLTVTNTYTPVKASIDVSKNFTDWGKEDAFEFTLTAGTNTAGDDTETPMPKNSTVTARQGDVDKTFGEITFEKAGTYNYTIQETDGGKDGVTYDTDAHSVVVVVTADPDTNELSAEVTYDNDETLVVTNTYESTKAELQATKSFNRWDLVDEFTFTLQAVDDAPMPTDAENGAVVKTATEEHKTVNFGEIEYEASGVYNYTIVETDDGVGGVTYDSAIHNVVVTVTKGEGNQLVTSVEYDGDESLTIENEHSTLTSAPIEVTKDFENWDKASSFTFKLAPIDDAPMPNGSDEGTKSAVATENNPTATFGSIAYDKEGTYQYTIMEQNSGADGVSYDTSEHTVTVVVTKGDDSNDLVATVKYDGTQDELEITNTYTPVKAPISVTKELTGRDWTDSDSFDFQLEAVAADAPMPTESIASATLASNKIADFGELTFEKEGVYEYNLTEVKGDYDGVTYDGQTRKVKVVVTKADDETNELTAVVTYDGDEDESLTVTNEYSPTTATIEVTKSLTGREWLDDDAFTFVLAPVDDAPMPDKTTATATADEQTVDFGSITYKESGEYEYTVTERNGGIDGVSYDTATHQVVVTVTKDDDNNLSATVTYDGVESLTVTNEYGTTSAEIEVTKDFQGRDWTDEAFDFTLTPIDNAPMPDNATATATANEPTVGFGDIIFENAGTYEYIVKETNGEVDGISYDVTEHKVVVTVVKAEDATNALTATVSYGEDVENLTITNEFEATTAQLQVAKDFNDWSKADNFTFTLEAEDDAPMPQSATNGKATATASQGVNAVFDEITYDKAGTYVYTITETDDGKDGVTYDTEPHTVIVEVTKADDATNALSASVTYDQASALTIINKYNSAKATIQASKVLNGRDWTDETFDFTLTAGDSTDADGAAIDTPMPEDATDGIIDAAATATNATAVFGEIEYLQAGEYHYTITETNGKIDGISYDTSEHEVVVTVTKGEKNKLSVDVKYDGEDSLTITNEFMPVKTTLRASKEFDRWDIARSFTFNLAAASAGAPMPESKDSVVVTEDASSDAFGEITFDKVGVYTYTITEVNDHVAGVTYDTKEHTVTVEVTKADDATNALSAEVTYDSPSEDGKSLVIENTYEPVKDHFETTKSFNDWKKADSFTFQLDAVTTGAPMPEKTTASATENKAAVFDDITFEAPGVYEYTITEQNGEADGVSYDIEPKNAIVTVTADPETNELSAVVTYDGKESLTVENTYTATSTEIEVTKDFQGRDWTDETFDFTLTPRTSTDANGETIETPMPSGSSGTASATASASEKTVDFGSITFETAGTYEYTITEVNGKVDGIRYDTSEHKVVVTVIKTDDETNALSASVTYDGDTSLTILNEFTPVEEHFEVTKKFNGWDKADYAGETFTFELEAVDDAPMPDETTVDVAATSPTGIFDNISFDQTGTYEYTITEVAGQTDGVLYDTKSYSAKVIVTKTNDETNALHTEVVYEGKDSLTVTNKLTAVEILKIDEDGEPLEDATLQLLDGDIVVDEWLTDSESHEIRGLTAGAAYTLRETEAPDGYVVVADQILQLDSEGKIDESNSTVNLQDGVIILKDKRTRISIKKVDIASGEELAGAVIQILNLDGEVVEEWTSDGTAHEVTGLKTGVTYTFREDFAPAGYAKAAETTFTLNADGTIDRDNTTTSTDEDGALLIEDPAIETITVKKVWKDKNDADNLRPKSITVQLYANGEKYGDKVVLKASTDWKHTWKDIPAKTDDNKKIKYTVKEVEVPDGYTVSYSSAVTEEGVLTITNTHTVKPKVPKTPDTGDRSMGGSIATMILAILGLGGVAVGRKRNQA